MIPYETWIRQGKIRNRCGLAKEVLVPFFIVTPERADYIEFHDCCQFDSIMEIGLSQAKNDQSRLVSEVMANLRRRFV